MEKNAEKEKLWALGRLSKMVVYDTGGQAAETELEPEEVQDRKILYFDPPNEHIALQRNLAGLSEGIEDFFEEFAGISDPQGVREEKYEIIELDGYNYTVFEFEKDHWIGMLIELDFGDQGTSQKHSMDVNGLHFNIVKHFIQGFLFFNGCVSRIVSTCGKPELRTLLDRYKLDYQTRFWHRRAKQDRWLIPLCVYLGTQTRQSMMKRKHYNSFSALDQLFAVGGP
jgi:hypothetical protein